MKKLLMMAAVAGMVFASCSNENEEYAAQANQETEISFASPVLYKTTRANEVPTTTYPKDECFRVFGIKYADKTYPGWAQETNVNEFTEDADGVGTLVLPRKHDGVNVTGWFPAKKHLFEENQKYAFAAYSPADLFNETDVPLTPEATLAPAQGAVTYTNAGLQVVDYTIQADLKDQVDFMYSNRVYDKDKNTIMAHTGNGNNDYDGVNLVFKHGLSSIHFKTCVDPQYLKAMQASGFPVKDGDFQIKSIKIKQAINKGSFKEKVDLGQDANKNYVSAGAWTPDSKSKADYVFFQAGTSGEETYTNVPFPDDVNSPIADELRDVNDPAYYPNTRGFSGILMPQTLADDAVVEIMWKVNTAMEAGAGHEVWSEKTTTIKLNEITKDATNGNVNGIWMPGKRYTYNIIFKENLMYFAPQVEAWEDIETNINPN